METTEDAAVAVEDAPAGLYDGIVGNLVTQFSSALDCFRELVQNSIDAGTPRVDVWMEYLPGEGHDGTIAIHVEDFGEGMDEAIIDNQFTQLFASTKDDDLTKIGKFGIGFVSVFAMNPRAVLVHTGRSGEYWEVLFHEDRSFSKTRVDNPVEGTQITLFLSGEYHRYQQLAEEIPATLTHWCSHSEVEVTFEDRSNNEDFAPPQTINQPFEVEGVCLTKVEHQGTEIVLAYSETPIFGFYNRGLTLALSDIAENVIDGTRRSRYEFIAFKILSRYLAHTLARDSVVHDEQYERAMELLAEAANGPLLDALVEKLEALVAEPSWDMLQRQEYFRLMAFLSTEPIDELVKRRDRKIFRTFVGEPRTLDEIREEIVSEQRCLISDEISDLIEVLGKEGIPVMVGLGGGRHRCPVSRTVIRAVTHMAERTARGVVRRGMEFMKGFIWDDVEATTPRIVREALQRPEAVYLPMSIDADQRHHELLAAAQGLLRAAGTPFRRLATGVVTSDGDNPFFVVAPRARALMARPQGNLTEARRARLEAVVNREHPQFHRILAAYRQDRALGAYLLARGLLLNEDFMLEAERKLMEAALPEQVKQYS